MKGLESCNLSSQGSGPGVKYNRLCILIMILIKLTMYSNLSEFIIGLGYLVNNYQVKQFNCFEKSRKFRLNYSSILTFFRNGDSIVCALLEKLKLIMQWKRYINRKYINRMANCYHNQMITSFISMGHGPKTEI